MPTLTDPVRGSYELHSYEWNALRAIKLGYGRINFRDAMCLLLLGLIEPCEQKEDGYRLSPAGETFLAKNTLIKEPSMTTPTSNIIGMKHFNKEKNRWHGVVCQVVTDDDGKENIMVLDVLSAEHEVDIDAAIETSIKTKPWIIQ